MDDVPPEMREQWRLQPAFDAVQEYGEHLDEFGGVYWARDPRRVVFLVTAHLDQHRAALLSRVSHPDRVEVRRSRHTEVQIRLWIDEVHQRFRDRHRALSVTGFGQSLGEEGFTVQVTIWPWSEETADRVRHELAPIPVEVEARPPVQLLPPFRTGSEAPNSTTH